MPGELWDDFTEANSWIYTWHVFQDPDGLARLMGGREKACAKLDEFFSTPCKDTAPLKAGRIGQYWHGNEPSHHVAYFYSLWGRREKTAEIVRKICREAYRPKPGGLCGNDDCGQMSAWYLFSMMGFYPVNPCGDGYVLGEAQAEEVKLRVGSCEFRVVGAEVGDNSSSSRKEDNNSILQLKTQTPTLNGKPVKGVKISHEDIIRGGTLVFGDSKGEQ